MGGSIQEILGAAAPRPKYEIHYSMHVSTVFAPLNPNVCTQNSAELTERGHNSPQIPNTQPNISQAPVRMESLATWPSLRLMQNCRRIVSPWRQRELRWMVTYWHRPWLINHGHCCALAKHVAVESRAPRAHHSPPHCPSCDLLYYVRISKVKVSNFQSSLFFQFQSV